MSEITHRHSSGYMKRRFLKANAALLTALLCLTGCDDKQSAQVYAGENFCLYAEAVSGRVISKPTVDYVLHRLDFNGTKISIFEGGGLGYVDGQNLKGRNGWVWIFGRDGPKNDEFIFFRHTRTGDWPGHIQVHVAPEDIDKINKPHLLNGFQAREAGQDCPLPRKARR